MQGLSETSKKKIVAMRKRWKRLNDEAAGEILAITNTKKDNLEVIREEAKSMGVEKSAMNKAMKALDHLDKALGVRDTIEDETILGQFDGVMLAMQFPGFEEIAPRQSKSKSKSKSNGSGKKAPAKKAAPKSPAAEAAKDMGIGDDAGTAQSTSTH